MLNTQRSAPSMYSKTLPSNKQSGLLGGGDVTTLCQTWCATCSGLFKSTNQNRLGYFWGVGVFKRQALKWSIHTEDE